MKGLIGKKVGMTQVFNDEGNVVPVTVIDITSCEVIGHRTMEKDQYTAVILGFKDAKEKHLTKPMAGSFKKAGVKAKRVIREFRVEAAELRTSRSARPSTRVRSSRRASWSTSRASPRAVATRAS